MFDGVCRKGAMKLLLFLISSISVFNLSNCQTTKKRQSENEEYVNSVNESSEYYETEGSGDYSTYGSGDYYYEYDNPVEFADFPKCCPEGKVSLQGQPYMLERFSSC